MNVDFPFHFDQLRRTAQDPDDEHIRDMIEQVLLTNPGERVNRPDFGCGLLHRVFEPNGAEAAALEFTIAAALQQWLGDLLQVTQLTVSTDEAKLVISVEYALLPSLTRRLTTVTAPGVGLG